MKHIEDNGLHCAECHHAYEGTKNVWTPEMGVEMP